MSANLAVSDEAEVAIVGGVPAGSVAAFTLASLGHDVILIDKCSFPRDKACGDGLTSSAVAFLYELGLEHVLTGAQPIEDLRLFADWREQDAIALRAGSAARSHQACCVPRKQFDHALVDMACAAGARLVQGYVMQPQQRDGSVIGVELTRGDVQVAIRARHVIGADGATSRLCRQLRERRVRPTTFAYAVRRYVHSDRPFAPAFEIYVPLPGAMIYGYGWVFPISERVANIGVGYLSTKGLSHPRSISRLLDSFIAGLRRYHGDRLGGLDPMGRAIGGSFGGDFWTERDQLGEVMLLGDAAQATDPITGEGIDQAMRSAYSAAVALDRGIRRGTRHVNVSPMLRRANLRLGQDSAMMARLAHHLLKRRATQPADLTDLLSAPGPLLASAAAMLAADVAYPSPVATPVGHLALELGCIDHLHALDEQLREKLQNEFILASELLQREVCAGLGPVAALAVIAGELACGSEPDGRSVDAGLCVELLSAFPAMLSRVTAADTPNANMNNGLAVMIGDYSLCRSFACAPDLGAEASEAFGEAVEANSEGVGLLARDRGQVTRSADRYLEWARLTSGTNLSLAASLSARLAGADRTTMDTLRALGESLGVAVQICEDILALTGDDPVTGRRPRHALQEGHFALPTLLAVAEDSSLESLLVAKNENAEWDEIVNLIRRTTGLPQAVEICEQYAEQARSIAVEIAGEESPLAALCELPERASRSRLEKAAESV